MDHKRIRHEGFTLIEMIVVIVLTSIIASAVAVFIRVPVLGYVDTARRAEMTDIADTALRRIGRDLRLALPNSVRLTDSDQTIEILITRTGGRYRVEPAGDVLDFSIADNSFAQLGPLAGGTGQAIVPNADYLVVYNLGISGANAYAGDNTALITAIDNSVPTAPVITFNPKMFPFESPGGRFQVIEGPVSYVCAGGTLTRYWGYTIQSTPQPTAASLPTLAGVQHALLATNVDSCQFDYSPGITARSGLVTLMLVIKQSGESVRLYHEVHVTNVP